MEVPKTTIDIVTSSSDNSIEIRFGENNNGDVDTKVTTEKNDVNKELTVTAANQEEETTMTNEKKEV